MTQKNRAERDKDCDWYMFGACVRGRTGNPKINPFSKACKGVCKNWVEGPMPPKEIK